jgi:hypothetical protein
MLIVTGFIGLLNVAAMMTLFGQTGVAGSGGVNDTTVGGVSGATGFPAPEFLPSSPHPATNPIIRNAMTHIIRTVNLRISFSYSIGGTALPAAPSRLAKTVRMEQPDFRQEALPVSLQLRTA